VGKRQPSLQYWQTLLFGACLLDFVWGACIIVVEGFAWSGSGHLCDPPHKRAKIRLANGGTNLAVKAHCHTVTRTKVYLR
jgi:hypothetical protein